MAAEPDEDVRQGWVEAGTGEEGVVQRGSGGGDSRSIEHCTALSGRGGVLKHTVHRQVKVGSVGEFVLRNEVSVVEVNVLVEDGLECIQLHLGGEGTFIG